MSQEQLGYLSADEHLKQYEIRSETVQERRQKLIAKMADAIDAMDLHVTEKSDPDLVQSQSRAIEQYRQLLNDVEASERNLITTKLKKKDSDSSALQVGQISDFLKNIKFSNGVPMEKRIQMSEEDMNRMLDSQFDERGCIVVETELELNGRQLPEKKQTEDM